MLPGIEKGQSYSRRQLAKHLGYAGYQALARGVVTPRGSKAIILFVTELKQPSAEPYQDKFDGRLLHWEGPNDHFAEDRILAATASGDEVHVFFRKRHHRDFIYSGTAKVVEYRRRVKQPSQFIFEVE